MPDYALSADPLGAPLASEVYRLVCRTDLNSPGFCLIDFGGSSSRRLREEMVRLQHELARRFESDRGLTLAPFSLGRFDQQVSTRFHLDGGPSESLLVLGYEPSGVASRVSIADYARAAADRGFGPQEYLAQFNPIFPAGEAALAGHVTEVVEFRADRAQILVVNNSRREAAAGESCWRGVLHRATIPAADPSRSRVINSMLLAPAAHGDAHLPPEAVERFVATDEISGLYQREA